VGLLHMAAAMDDGEAQLALAHRYKHGLGVETSSEASAFYFSAAAEKSATLFHTTGRQPANELSNRLRDGEETKVANRERGGDDEELRLLVIQAEEQFHAPSMHQVAGLLYWGHRGFGRDQKAVSAVAGMTPFPRTRPTPGWPLPACTSRARGAPRAWPTRRGR